MNPINSGKLMKIISIVIVAILFLRYGKRLLDRIFTGLSNKQKQAQEDANNVPTTKKENGKIVETSVNTMQLAQEIYDSFFNDDWFGFGEDEERAYKALMEVPIKNVSQLKDNYIKLKSQHNKKGTLYEDFNKYCSDQIWWNTAKVKLAS